MTPCVEAAGYRNQRGYVLVTWHGRQWLAHRLAWVRAHGPVPAGLFVLHHCDNPPCVSLDHLYLGTKAQNTADMMARGRNRNQNTDRTHCKWGHEFTPDNTYRRPDGRRACRACQSSRDRGLHPSTIPPGEEPGAT